MAQQIDKQLFKQVLIELGHDPQKWQGRHLSLEHAAAIYDIHRDHLVTAIKQKLIASIFDYTNNRILVDAMDMAHFFFCVKHYASLADIKT